MVAELGSYPNDRALLLFPLSPVQRAMSAMSDSSEIGSSSAEGLGALQRQMKMEGSPDKARDYVKHFQVHTRQPPQDKLFRTSPPPLYRG